MTKKLFFLLPILLTAFSISAQTRTDKLLKNLHDNESKYIFVIAHRGDWRNAPENSLQSIEKAIAMKVDMIELDIQPTKDGNFICMHDETLDRTSTGKGPIKDYTTEELKKFVLRSGNGIKTRQPIPTLKEALNVCKGRILVNIDKGGTYIKEIMPIIQECGMEKQVIIKGYYPVEKVKKEYGSNESMLYMPIVNLWDKEAVATIQTFIKNFTPIAYELCFKDDANPNLKIIDEIAKSGSRVWMNTLWDSLCGGHDDDRAVELHQPEESWGWIINQGAKLIQTDRPALLLEYLRKKKLHD